MEEITQTIEDLKERLKVCPDEDRDVLKEMLDFWETELERMRHRD